MVFEQLAVHELKNTGDKGTVFNALQILETIDFIGKELASRSAARTGIKPAQTKIDSAARAEAGLSDLLRQVGDHWESTDQKLFVDETDSDNSDAIALEFNSLYSKIEPHSATAKNPIIHESQNKDRESTSVSISDHQVHIEKKDSQGNSICSIDKTKNSTTIKSGEEEAKRSNEKTTCTGRGCKIEVSADGTKKVSTKEGWIISRDGKDKSQAKIEDCEGDVCKVSKKQVIAGEQHGHPIIFTTAETNLAKATEQIRERLHPDQIGLLVIKNAGNRLIFGSGTVIDIKGKQVRIQTKSGEIVSLETRDGKFYIKGEDGYSELNKGNCPECIKVQADKFLIDGIELDTNTFQLRGKRIHIDLKKDQQTIIGDSGKKATVCTEQDGCTTVRTDNHTLNNNQHDNSVDIKNNRSGAQLKIDLDREEIRSKIITDKSDQTVINETGTKIYHDGSVDFNNGYGPKLFIDGSVQVDNNTYISKDMDVTSGGWQSSSNNSARYESAMPVSDVSSVTSSAYAKALAGTIKWSDVSELNICAGQLLSLMATLPAGSPLLAKIKDSLAQVLNTLSFATAKVALNRSNMEDGTRYNLNPQ